MQHISGLQRLSHFAMYDDSNLIFGRYYVVSLFLSIPLMVSVANINDLNNEFWVELFFITAPWW